MIKRFLCPLGSALLMTAACSGTGNADSADGGGGGTGDRADAVASGDSAQPIDAPDGAVPPLCGSFELGPGPLYTSGSMHGVARTSVGPGSVISPSTFPTLSTDDQLCVHGVVAQPSQGFGWASLSVDVNGVVRSPPPADGGTNADGGVDAPANDQFSFVPSSDGLVVSFRNKDDSPLWLCLLGANFDQWCVKQLEPDAFIPWTSFLELSGSGVAYANEPIITIGLTVPDPRPAASMAFDFCLDSVVEAAGWCACSGGGCACPKETTACGATCVGDLSTNPNNCGACGTVCSATSACTVGECRDALISGLDPLAIALDATSIYFTDPGLGTVMKASLAGDMPTTLASAQMAPLDIAVDSTSVYWSNQGTSANGFADGTIMKVPLDGGAPVTLASGQTSLGAIAVDGTNVYWTNAGTMANGFADGTIMEVPLAGGVAPVTLASGQTAPQAIAVDATSVYWANYGSTSIGNAVADGSIEKVPLGGGTPITLASGQVAPDNIAVDGTSVYWTTTGTVAKAPLTGGTPVILATGQSLPSFMTIDGASVYWTNQYGGSAAKVPLAGGPAVTLATGQNYALGIAVDATSVYFATYDGAGAGGVLRIAK